MRERGHEVWLVTPPDGRLAARAADEGIEVVPHRFERPRLLFDSNRLARLLRRLQPDVANSHSSSDSWTAALARRLGWRSGALVRTRHISAPVAPGPLHRFLYGQADYLITTGESVREGLARSGLVPLDRSVSIPTGVDPARFHPRPGERGAARRSLGVDGEGPVIGVVAYLRPDKGHEVLLRSLPAILRSHPTSTLVVVGDGPERGPLEARADGLGVLSRVRFTGLREDIPYVLPAFDVFCLPSLRNEGVPQSILQASAAGLPVVSTAVGGIPEAVVDGETGRVVAPGDPKALSEAIVDLLSNAGLRRAFGEAGRERAHDRFSLESMLDRTEAAYRAALECATEARSAAGPSRR